jgi:hypothetical protein
MNSHSLFVQKRESTGYGVEREIAGQKSCLAMGWTMNDLNHAGARDSWAATSRYFALQVSYWAGCWAEGDTQERGVHGQLLGYSPEYLLAP